MLWRRACNSPVLCGRLDVLNPGGQSRQPPIAQQGVGGDGALPCTRRPVDPRTVNLRAARENRPRAVALVADALIKAFVSCDWERLVAAWIKTAMRCAAAINLPVARIRDRELLHNRPPDRRRAGATTPSANDSTRGDREESESVGFQASAPGSARTVRSPPP